MINKQLLTALIVTSYAVAVNSMDSDYAIEPYNSDLHQELVCNLLKRDGKKLVRGFEESNQEVIINRTVNALQGPYVHTHVLSTDGRPVGLVSFCYLERPCGTTGYIELLAVEEKERRKGFGMQLLTHAIAELERNNIKTILIDTHIHNTPARNLYARYFENQTTKNDIISFTRHKQRAFSCPVLFTSYATITVAASWLVYFLYS